MHSPSRLWVFKDVNVQENKGKVRLVMDYRELNNFVDTHTANTDICAQKLRKWRQQGNNVVTLNLSRAYLQVHRLLWPFQTVMIKGQRYCLTQLGFGLYVAPKITSAIINASCHRMRKFEGH